jgi:DNA-binding transcriptional ArsR family regulator
LAKLREAGLLAVEAQGRHRYFRIADADVAQLLESMMGVAFGTGAVRVRSSPREPALRKARVCYDHLAGELGVLVYESLARRGAFALDAGGVALTDAGRALVAQVGIDPLPSAVRRPLCRHCLDWSERRHHLAGALGTALLERFQQLGWARRVPDSRVLAFSADGEAALRAWLG